MYSLVPISSQIPGHMYPRNRSILLAVTQETLEMLAVKSPSFYLLLRIGHVLIFGRAFGTLCVLTATVIFCAYILCHLRESLDSVLMYSSTFACLPGYLMAPVLVFIFLFLFLQWLLLGPCFNLACL